MKHRLWPLLIALIGGSLLLPSGAQELRRIAFLPFEASEADDQWLGHLVADVAERAMGTNSLADVPHGRERQQARRDMRASFADAAVRNPASAASALDLDFIVKGWARRDGDMAIFDAELIETAGGSRLLAQTFRSPAEDPLDAALLMASRISETVFGSPLLSYATQVVRPVTADAQVLEAYGRGLVALDAAAGAAVVGELRRQSSGLVQASNHLALAVNRQPELLWPYDALLEASNAIIDMDPSVAAAYVNIGIAEAALGDLPGAVAILREGRRAVDDDATVRVVLANYLLDLAAKSNMRKAELLDEARQAASEAARLEPDRAGAWMILGAAAFDAADYPAAAEAYGRGVEIDPLDPVAQLGKGLSLVRQGLWENARMPLRAVLDLVPGSAYAARAQQELDRIAAP